MTRRRLLDAALRGLTAALLIAAMLAWLPADARAQNGDRRKQILLLNSYHQNFAWNESVFRGLTDVLRPKETGIILHVENMDTKRVEFNEHYVQQLHDVFEHKFKGMNLDLIMVTDNNAFEFLRRYHSELFPDVPVVFCGVNNFRDEMLEDHPLFTGVAENVDARGTLWWALALHPEARFVYVVNDFTSSGKALAQSIRDDLKQFAPEVKVRFSGNLILPEIVAQVKTLPKDSLILFGSYYRDRMGRFYDIAEAVMTLSTETDLPVYGLFDFDLGHGIVGGMLSSGYDQGQAMAQMALHVLAGRRPHDIPVIRSGVSTPMFDYEQLRKHHIGMENLPEDSEIINRPRTFYTEHMEFIWLGAGFTVVQMIIILALVVNTSRRRQAEKELRRAHQSLEERVRERTGEVKESVEALRTVFDASHDGIFIHDVTGRILDFNARMLKLYGLDAGDIPDLSIARDISSRNNAVYRLSAIWRSVINGEPQYFEWKARRPHDGSEFDAEVYLNRIVFHGQEAILANVRDITVRKESENRIRQSLSKFEAILENSLMGIAMTRGREFATINRRGAEIFGYTPGELIGHSLSLLLNSRAKVEGFIKASRTALTDSGEFNTEQAFRDRDGNVVWCRMYAKAVDPESLEKGVIWAWDDVTDQRRSQEELMRAREDAEAANRAKSEFLAAMSHEIRTPMNAIVGMTDITLQTDLTDDQRDYLRTVMDSAQHLLDIINDILDLSKIEARKLTLDRTDFDLPFHVRTTIKGLEVQARQKGLSLLLDVAEDVPACVKGDPLSLRQVLVNLVGNAIKFTHKGSVVVRVRPAEPAARDNGESLGVHFEVEDTGIGIPEEFLDTVFLSFSQTTRAFGGTGLGLAICKRLIDLMGGDIRVESQVGSGSVFSFTAWFEQGVYCPVQERRQPDMPDVPAKPIRLLVAEDNDVNVMVTTLRLDEMGYDYRVAHTGLEVLDLLKQDAFDLILMDIEMPVLDGISATKAIRSSAPGGPIPDPDIPIVGVTAHALKEFRDKSLNAGMDDYVSKPVNFHELARIITRLVGSSPLPPQEGREEGPDAEPAGKPAPKTEDASGWSPETVREDLGVDEVTFNGFLSTARQELKTLVEELDPTLAANDLENAAGLVKTLKAICSSIGAPAAALAAARMHRRLRKGKSASSETLKTEIEHLLRLMTDP